MASSVERFGFQSCVTIVRFTATIGFSVLLLTSFGCGRRGLGLFSGNLLLIVELENVSYLHLDNSSEPIDSSTGSLYALGDINKDGYTDFVISARRPWGSGGGDRGWVAAYSGKEGTVLWQMVGKNDADARADGEESGYHLKEIFLVGDLNNDGIPDIYCRDAYYKRTVFLLSGQDGSRIGRFPVEVTPGMLVRHPLCSHDVNGDGADDFLFSIFSDPGPTIQILSGTDLKPMEKHSDFWPETIAYCAQWVLPRFGDVNNDGTDDHLLRRGLKQDLDDPVYTYEMAFVSGADFSVIRSFESPRPRSRGQEHHATTGDLDRDGMADILMTASTGEGPDTHSSFIRAFSGADGQIIWQLLGTQFKAGQQTFLINTKTGERTDLAPDIEFKGPVLSLPDINSDSIRDVATVAILPGTQRTRQGVLLFSGTDGVSLGTLELPASHWKLNHAMVLLESVTNDGQPGVAVVASTDDKKTAICIFRLPQSG